MQLVGDESLHDKSNERIVLNKEITNKAGVSPVSLRDRRTRTKSREVGGKLSPQPCGGPWAVNYPFVCDIIIGFLIFVNSVPKKHKQRFMVLT